MLTNTLSISAAEKNFFSGFKKYCREKQVWVWRKHFCSSYQMPDYSETIFAVIQWLDCSNQVALILKLITGFALREDHIMKDRLMPENFPKMPLKCVKKKIKRMIKSITQTEVRLWFGVIIQHQNNPSFDVCLWRGGLAPSRWTPGFLCISPLSVWSLWGSSSGHQPLPASGKTDILESA